MPSEIIHEIIVMSGDPEKPQSFRTCTWGYYFDKENAAECIENNWTDISELGYYQYAVLTAKGEGPLAIGQALQWYEFQWEGRKFRGAIKIAMPAMYDRFFF